MHTIWWLNTELQHAHFWVTNHRTCWYMFLNRCKSSIVYTIPYITKLVSDEGPLQHRAWCRKELFFWNSKNRGIYAVLNLFSICCLKVLLTIFNWRVYLQNVHVNNKMSVPNKFITSCNRLERWDHMKCNRWYCYLICFIYYAFHFW
jgi:hypothetical protein